MRRNHLQHHSGERRLRRELRPFRMVLFIVTAFLFILPQQSPAQRGEYNWDSLYHALQQDVPHIWTGLTMKALFNVNGILGQDAFPNDSLRQGAYFVEMEYPIGSGVDHLHMAGLCVGARVRTPTRNFTAVSTATIYADVGTRYPATVNEFSGLADPRDTFYVTGMDRMNEPNRRGFDDDGDGRVDEDDLDGYDNDGDWMINRDDHNHNGSPDPGEPNVDEDYGAVSELDVSVAYSDSFRYDVYPRHTPLGLRIWQKSFAWKDRIKEPIMPFEFTVVNRGKYTLDSLFVGLFSWPLPHKNDMTDEERLELENVKWGQRGSYRDLRTVYEHIPVSFITPTGITVLGASKSLSSMSYSCLPWMWSEVPQSDAALYDSMKSGVVVERLADRSPKNYWLQSLGPFDRMEPGDSVKFTIAIISGNGLETGAGALRGNALKAIDYYNRNYQPPASPPSPPLRITPVANGVRLDWQWRPGDPKFDPMETWDDSNHIINALPDTHWRRRNPPPGKTGGGRIIEGFRIWRSDYSVFDEKQFNLLYQFDVNDDLDFEGQTGIAFSYIDSTIRRGKSYWYTVTSISIPDYVFIYYQTASGEPAVDTALSDLRESKIFENVVKYGVPFLASTRVGEAKVVPNPYRTDRNYIYEQGGWEGLGRLWTENRRVVWFIHLPPKCTIRIFSLAGEVIKTISHDDNDRQSRNLAVAQEEFELLSESNRALASGIYIYLVESEFGTQTGKFVVIR